MLASMADGDGRIDACFELCCDTPQHLTFSIVDTDTQLVGTDSKSSWCRLRLVTWCQGCGGFSKDEPDGTHCFMMPACTEPPEAEEPQKPTEAQQRAFAQRNAQALDQVLKILDKSCVTRKELLYACAGYTVSVARACNQDPIERVYAELNMLEALRARLAEGGE